MPRTNLFRKILEKSYATDYIGLAALLFAYIWIQFTVEPFHPLIALDDLRIQHPFAERERVPVGMMFVYGGAVPLVALVVIAGITRPGWQILHATILGLLISLVLTSFVTDIIKNAVGRPRPDFISRCKPKEGLPEHTLQTIDVCTEENKSILAEGLRSFPSGHSSFSFSGLGYLSVYLAGRLRVFRPRADLARALIALAPFLGALMIAISRLEDYRHDVYDVTAGSILGLTIAHTTYRRYYPALSSPECSAPYSPTASGKHGDRGNIHDEEEGIGLRRPSYESVQLHERQ